jgi:protein TonB
MSYKALLFCPDERTAKTVTQVLSELEFQVEACNEPFAAVKLLMAGHFDAVVVDCDNEQNATLLFKSARNSEFNQASLSVAVVEGQSGVAKAFRIGANLVLTKPINVEQSKGTLRVARGLLRKNEAAKTSGKAPEAPARSSITAPPFQSASAPAPKPAFLTHAAPTLAPAAMASSSSAFELEKDPAPEPEPAEAAFLESVSDQANQIHAPEAGASAPKQYPWQPVPKPMAEPMTTALKHAAEATGRIDSVISVGHGAAVAPALDPNFDEEDSHHSSSSAVAVVKPHSAASSVNWGRIGAIIFVAVAAGAIYRAGTQLHWQMQPVKALLHQSTAPATPQIAKPTAGIPASATPAPGASPATGPVQPGVATTVPQNSAQLLTVPGANPQKPPSATETIVLNPATRKPAVPASSFDPPPPPGVVKTIGEGSPDTIMVDTQKPKPASPKPATETVEPTAPDAVTADSKSNDSAISGLMSMPAGVAQPGPQTLKVSQGVSQGLLVKKVAPVYPAQAMQAHLQGSVQLLATISKEGNITNVKALSGESVLARAAMDAVRQWKYKPYYLNTEPIEIQTQITVNFTLP